MSRAFSTISPNSTDAEFIAAYENVFRSAECLTYCHGAYMSSKTYNEILNLQMTDAETLTAYLNMNFAFSGEPIRLTPRDRIAVTCEFPIAIPHYGRRLQSSNCT